MLGISDISGGGGAERQFADIYEFYQKRPAAKFDLSLITDDNSYLALRSIGKLKAPWRVIRIHNYDNLFKGRTHILPITVQLLAVFSKHKFDLIHVTLPGRYYLPVLHILSLLPKKQRPRITMNVVDCSVAHHYLGLRADLVQVDRYNRYFKSNILDGVFTWYKLFKEVAEKQHIIKSNPLIVAAQFCFTDLSRFTPLQHKKNQIVYAGRMVETKQPLFFIEAVRVLRELDPTIIEEWQFLMFGKGPLEHTVRQQIEEYALADLIELTYQPDLAPVFAQSKVFVSTQDHENFTSLSMLEAMAAGNAVISRNVGQTDYFVKHRQNGLLLSEDTPQNLACTMLEYICHSDLHQSMQQKSREIATRVHTVENFLLDIDNFWSKVLSHKQTQLWNNTNR